MKNKNAKKEEIERDDYLKKFVYNTLKEKIGCCSKLDGKIWHF